MGGAEADVSGLPLHTTKLDPFIHLNRIHAATYACAVLYLLYLHCLALLRPTSTPLSVCLSSLLLLSDAVIALLWAFVQAFRWRPLRREAFPERLASSVDASSSVDLPDLDVFICTADPHKEPPAGVVGTALSVMGFDYPATKLSVYLSDDGCSELTLFAFMEAARFARSWLPFCRDNGVLERSPEAYFASNDGPHNEKIKILYERMKARIEGAVKAGRVDPELLVSEEEREALRKWDTGFTTRDHPSIIQVLLESGKDVDIAGHPLPNLVYVSREKSKATPHHFKAGALNALVRVSSAMTNAPIVLTQDCDMVSNDPTTPMRALCYHLDGGIGPRLAFVQFPQRYRGINEHDIYGSDLKRLFQINPLGMDGLQGTNYVGTGAFFSRRCLHGGRIDASSDTTPCRPRSGSAISSEEVLRSAHEVSGCAFEDGTKWGSTVGFRYGSLVEDYFTGYSLHCEGWTTVFCNPQRPAFLGDAPVTLHDALSQTKRWCVGLFEVAFSDRCPLTYGVRRSSFLTGLCYAHYAFWGMWCIPLIVYGIVPPLSLFYRIPLFPKAMDPHFFLYCYLFLAAYGQDLSDFLRSGGTTRRWWNDQRMWMIRGVTSYPLGLAEFALKQLGVSSSGFNVTSKVMEEEKNILYEEGKFELGEPSPFLLSLATLAVTNLVSFAVGLARVSAGGDKVGDWAVQLFLSGFVAANCWPIYEAMALRKDSGRVPRKSTTAALSLSGALFAAGYIASRGPI